MDMQSAYREKKNLQDPSLPTGNILTINYWMALQFEEHISSTLFVFLLAYINYLASFQPETIF